MALHAEEQLHISRLTYEVEGQQYEGLTMKPEAVGKFPGVIFVHGHNSSAWESTWIGYHLVRAGFSVFLPSQMGYGLAKGTPDFCGPKTVRGVLEGIAIFSKLTFVDADRIGIWGISRGATVAASCLVRAPHVFKAGVLQSGAYEMEQNFLTTQIPGIKELIEKEAGTTPQAFRERSPLYDMENLAAPALVIHGAKDDRISVAQAELLDRRMNELDKLHRTVILPEAGHYAYSREMRTNLIIPFLGRHLGSDVR